ncbi:MAG TPA: hypothetical protein VMF08_09355 [Candidatus Sulfotelmatobacter sp.]|nr:hypothetical protein [Candidatus Sulfotelmatobacter sp.]
MNDRELKARLNVVRVPERSDEYWNDFPAQVRLRLSRLAAMERPRTSRAPQWGWNGGLAFACAISVVLFVPLLNTALKSERTLQQDAEKFPRDVQALMTGDHGMQYLVADGE